MKYVLLLLSLFVISCSKDPIEISSTPKPPEKKTITLTIQEHWKSKVDWTDEHIRVSKGFCGDDEKYYTEVYNYSDLIGLEVPWESFLSIDTLIIGYKRDITGRDYDAFKINLSNRYDLRPNPTQIGHIEFIGFEEGDRLKVNNIDKIEDWWKDRKPIIYYSSNKSEVFIDALTITGVANGYEDCDAVNLFDKHESGESHLKARESEMELPFNETNNLLKEGMYIWKTNSGGLGGWGDYPDGRKAYLILKRNKTNP